MPKVKCTQAQVIKALRETKGMQFLAAKRLGVCAKTVQRYLERYPKVAEIVAEERGELVDTSELKLLQAVQAGEPWAIRLALETLGKDRGYSKLQEVEHSGGVDVNLNISEEERKAIAESALADLGVRLAGETPPGPGNGN